MNTILQSFQFLIDIGHLTKDVWKALWSRPFYPKLVINQIYEIGYKSWPIIFVTGASTGLVLCLQFTFTLEKYGLKPYVPKLIALSLFRELGPVFGGIVLAGRVGAGIAAEVGSMAVTQQIDALRALGTSPIKRIVIPRVLGSLISIPLLSLLLCAVAYIFAGISASYLSNMDFIFFTERFFGGIFFSDFMSGFIKTFFFAYIISMIACFYGLSASYKDENESVGGVTTLSVVASSVLIVISDFALTSILFWVIQ